ncbi:MAG: tryptophan synthase subunit alpha [Alphaproteobacteria bacterium]|nr:tryptophan synthase subunit alpha [Alphaproteobacteria bacterium]
MTRYKKLQEQINATGKAIYSPYVMLGYPTADISLEVCRVLIEGGVHALELGLPFRDPAADGPVIQAAGMEALNNGFTTAKGVEIVSQIRKLSADIPITLMCYYNMVLAKGADNFLESFASAGIDAILIPDLPPERAEEIMPAAHKHGVDVVFIASPLSDDSRLALMGEYMGGFVYVVTRLGITGSAGGFSSSLSGMFSRIHNKLSLPALAGFGISEPEQAVAMIKAGADGVITGSKLVQLIEDGCVKGIFDPACLAKHTREMIAAVVGAR